MYGEQSSIDEARPNLLARLVRVTRPREGWTVLVLAWTAVISLPTAAINARMIVGLEPMAWLATLALLLGWWLAHRRVSGLAAGAILAVSGAAADLIWGVRVVSAGPLIGQMLRWLAWLFGEREAPAPAFTYLEELGAALLTFGQRLAWWVDGLVSGQGVPDNLVVIGLVGLLTWTLGAWAGWWVARRGQPFLALLPTGAVLAIQAYWAEDVRWALIIFLGAVTMLLVMARLAWLMAGWEREGVDYSPELALDAVMTGMAFTTVVVILAPTLPFLTSSEVSQAFWRRFESPYRELEQRVGSSFAGLQPARSLAPAAGVASGGMPRAHLLGGRPELGEEIALRARVRGARLDEMLYWRGQTFAHYTGRGWDEAEADWSELRLAAGEPWNPGGSAAAGRSLINVVEVAAGSRAVLYAAGEPVAADRPYRARLRAAGELIALSASDGPSRYTILSQAIDPDPALLRRAVEIYPSTVISLYLQLPASLDPRLAGLAAEWTAGAATPYDRAVAIESALRRMPYTLDVPAPPAGREVVSWFVFDLGRGYCDYFASAMVVLARLSGIPARLAVGYAFGSYDPRSDQYVISELDAHSWPELYFPGYGWLRFEPTSAQPLAQPEMAPAGSGPLEEDYAGGPVDFETGMAELQALAADNTAATRRWLAAQALTGALCGLLLLSWLAGRRAGGRKMLLPVGVPPQAMDGFQRLARWGARLGRPLRAGDTPREYASAVTGQATAIALRSARRPVRAAAQAIGAGGAQLAEAYERAVFAPADAAPAPPQPQPWAAFRRLWLARVASRFRPK